MADPRTAMTEMEFVEHLQRREQYAPEVAKANVLVPNAAGFVDRKHPESDALAREWVLREVCFALLRNRGER